MKIAKYQDFIVIAHNVALQVSGGGHFDVQIFTPPAELTTPVRQRLPPELRHIQQRLEQRQMNEKEIIDFGKMLASVLLPPPELAHLLQLRDRLGVDEALRIRLRLPPSLASFLLPVFSIGWSTGPSGY